ncbi:MULTISPECIES: CHAT domain-containing protein [unclassified Psychrobacter]|uniref:CHAT domain-containing protein n=1 Tax=unclassified Psychrobacter TaxID=196806 RepID=UPI003FCFF217
MSSTDTYRRNVQRKREELQRLTQSRNKEQLKTNDLKKKMNSASLALSKAKSVSTIKSKSRDIQRLQSQIIAIDKKVTDYDKKISIKSKQIFDEEKKLAKEQDNENERIRKVQLSKLNKINTTLYKHEGVHESMTASIKELQNLPEKINVLFLASNPMDSQQLRLDEEARSIQETIRKTENRDSVLFESHWALRTTDLLQALNEVSPTIVHFSGHGTDTDEIVFQDNSGNSKFVSKEAIAQVMMSSSDKIRLVFFNTCYSYNQAKLVTNHVEVAIGMNTSIGDEAAIIFSSQFYSSIGFGLSVQNAFNQAKASIMLEGLNEENTPELFVQEGLNPNEIILVKP